MEASALLALPADNPPAMLDSALPSAAEVMLAPVVVPTLRTVARDFVFVITLLWPGVLRAMAIE